MLGSRVRKVLFAVVTRRRHRPAVGTTTDDVLPRSPVGALRTLISLKFSPSLHGNLAAVEFSFALSVAAALLITIRFAGFTPREVVKLPEGIDREDKVPNGERQEVDEHPNDVGPRVCGDDDENTRETKNETQEHQRYNLRRMMNDGCNNYQNKSIKSANVEKNHTHLFHKFASKTYRHKR